MKFLVKFMLVLSISMPVFGVTYTINVPGMHCPLCTAMVREALKKVDGVKSAKASLKDNNAIVEAEANVTKQNLLDAIKTTGYEGRFID